METPGRPAAAAAAAFTEKNKTAVGTAGFRNKLLTHRFSLHFTTSVLLAVATAAAATAAQRTTGAPAGTSPAYFETPGPSARHPLERSMRGAAEDEEELYPMRREGDQEELEATADTEMDDPMVTASKMPAMLETTEEQDEHDADSQATTRRSSRVYNRFRRPLSSVLASVTLARAVVAAALVTAVTVLGWYMYMAKAAAPQPREGTAAAGLDGLQRTQPQDPLAADSDRAALRGRLFAMLPGIVAGLSLLGAGLLIPLFQSYAAQRAPIGLNPAARPGATRTTGIVLKRTRYSTDAVTDVPTGQQWL